MSGGGWTGVGLLRAITGNLSVQKSRKVEAMTMSGRRMSSHSLRWRRGSMSSTQFYVLVNL